MKEQNPSSPAVTPTIRVSILWRMISQTLILTAFVIMVLTTLSFIISRLIVERSVLTQLSSVVTIGENTLEDILHSNRERASLLSSNTDIRNILDDRAGKPTLVRLLAILQRDQQSLVGIEVYDPTGALLASAGEAVDLPEQALHMPYHRPVVTASGWTFYDVFTPVFGQNNEREGYIGLRYDARAAFTPLLAVTPSLGTTAEVVFVRTTADGLELIHPSSENAQSYVLNLGQLTSKDVSDFILLRSLNGTEGVTRASDYRGRDALIAYRYLPTLGWGLAIQVERREALQDVRSLAIAHSAIGTLLLILAGVLASLLAHQFTQPLRSLTNYVRMLRPGFWSIKRSVHTGDEVELLDQVVVDMASRLKKSYEQQEKIIMERTQELATQYQLDRAVLESIEYGVIRVDNKGNVTNINPAAITMLGQKQSDLHSKDVAEAIPICGHRGNPMTGLHPVKQCLKTQKPVRSPVNAHFNVRRADDALLPVMYAVSPLTAKGKIIGAILVFQDITEERRLDYLKSEFISLASHQLRTPLSALRWYIELLADEKKSLTVDQRGYIDEMQQSINRMLALLTALLRAAHLDGENLEPDLRKTDLVGLLHEVDEDSRALLHEAGLKANFALPSKEMSINTDPTLLRIVLQNFINNAVKYTPKNSPNPLQIELSKTNNMAIISVEDHGIGIPSNEQSRVFQKFFRAKNVRKIDTDGNGLGLYIARTIIERLGGTITFVSAENKGTTFTLNLPLAKKAKAKKKK